MATFDAASSHHQFAICPLFFAQSLTFCIKASRRCWFVMMVMGAGWYQSSNPW